MKTYKKVHRKRTTKNKKQKIKRTKNKIKRTNYKKNRILGGATLNEVNNKRQVRKKINGGTVNENAERAAEAERATEAERVAEQEANDAAEGIMRVRDEGPAKEVMDQKIRVAKERVQEIMQRIEDENATLRRDREGAGGEGAGGANRGGAGGAEMREAEKIANSISKEIMSVERKIENEYLLGKNAKSKKLAKIKNAEGATMAEPTLDYSTAHTLLGIHPTNGIVGSVAFHFVLGPIMRSDRIMIEALRHNHEKVIVVAQGGLNPSRNEPWSTTLLAAFPANAGMNLGYDFANANGDSEYGWYDAFNTNNILEDQKNGIHYIIQLTNSAKPRGRVATDPLTPIEIQWLNFVDSLNTPASASIRDLIHAYKYISGNLPWMHDPLLVLAVMNLCFPNKFFPYVDPCGTWNEGYNFNVINGISGNLSAEFPIVVVPYKHNDDQLRQYHSAMKDLLAKILNTNTFINDPNRIDPTKKISITTSIEIYDSDNMVASKVLDIFTNALKEHGRMPIILHSAHLSHEIPFNNKLMFCARPILREGKKWVKQCLTQKNMYNATYGAVAPTVTHADVNTTIDTYNAKAPTYATPVSLMPPPGGLIDLVGFIMYAGCRDHTNPPHPNGLYLAQDQSFIRSLHQNCIVIPGGTYNKPNSMQCKFSEDAFCVIHSFFTPNTLGRIGNQADVTALIDSMLLEPLNGPTRSANITSWV